MREEVLCELVALLGTENVITRTDKLDFYMENVSGFPAKIVPAVVKPTNRQQVASLVNIANKHALNLYPISTGKNWGLGSKLPIHDNCVLVDLSNMNTIKHICDRYQYAIVEPGVTQQQLADHLQHINSTSILNVTGSSTNTSIVGNVLDRGTGIFGPRVCLGMEVVMGNGEIMQINNEQYAALYTSMHAGPNLHELFIQSNFGIVTAMMVALQPKLQNFIHVDFYVSTAKFATAIEKLRELRASGVLNNNIKIEDICDPRIKSYLGDVHLEGEDAEIWVGHTILTGPDEILSAKKCILERELKFCKAVLFVNKDDLDHNPYAAKYLNNCFKLYAGIPLNSNLNGILANDKLTMQDIDNDIDNRQIKLGFLSPMFALPLEAELLMRVK